jgi:hypothetical protein
VSAPRPLAPGEAAWLKTVYEDRLPYGAIRLHRGTEGATLGAAAVARVVFHFGAIAVALGNHIYLEPDVYAPDLSAMRGGVALLVHEAMHVWQYSRAGLAITPLRIALQSAHIKHLRGRDEYDVRHVTAETDFHALGYEQQASVAEKYAVAVLDHDAAGIARFGPVLKRGLDGARASVRA